MTAIAIILGIMAYVLCLISISLNNIHAVLDRISQMLNERSE
mgnify:CR=1 FL=1